MPSDPVTAARAVDHPRLLRAQQDVFLLDGRYRRWVASLQVFADHRFRWEWVAQVADEELSRIPRGPDLIAGPVLRATDGTLWIVYRGTRRRIAGPDAFAPLNLSPADAIAASDTLLASYPLGRPVGNPPRPWFLIVVAAFLAAATATWWWLAVGEATRRGGGRPEGAAGDPPSGPFGWPAAWLALGALAGVAAALRLYYAVLFPWVPDGADAESYVTTARYLAGGGSLLADGPFGGLTNVTSPLYPMILALTSGAVALAGGSVVGWKGVQVLVAGLLILPIADLTGRIYGRVPARCATLLAIVSPIWLYSVELLQYELWLAAFITVGLWALVRGAGAGRRARWWLAGAGLCLGLASFTQLKTTVLWLPIGLFILWLAHRQPPTVPGRAALATRGRPWLGGRLVLLACFVLPAATPVGIWGLRNLAVHGELLLASKGAGVLLWMGNHPNATGGYMQIPRPDAFYQRLERYPEGSITRESRASSELAWAFITTQPSTFLLTALLKLERFWWTITPGHLGAHAEGRMVAFLGGLVDATALTVLSKLLQIASLTVAGVGAIWGFGEARRQASSAGHWLILGAIALFWLVHIPFIAEPRYRIPIVPLLHALQGVGLALAGRQLDRALDAGRRAGGAGRAERAGRAGRAGRAEAEPAEGALP